MSQTQTIPSPNGHHLATEATGMNGADYIADASDNQPGDHVACWTVIEAVGDTTFTILTGGPTGFAGVATLKDGRRLFGQFTRIKLASGAVIAYRSPFNI